MGIMNRLVKSCNLDETFKPKDLQLKVSLYCKMDTPDTPRCRSSFWYGLAARSTDSTYLRGPLMIIGRTCSTHSCVNVRVMTAIAIH